MYRLITPRAQLSIVTSIFGRCLFGKRAYELKSVNFKQLLEEVFVISRIIIKITISSIVIGLKKSYFPLIRLVSCYRTVCYWI